MQEYNYEYITKKCCKKHEYEITNVQKKNGKLFCICYSHINQIILQPINWIMKFTVNNKTLKTKLTRKVKLMKQRKT